MIRKQVSSGLEEFQNVGRGTPSHAIQTIVWAVMKGDDGALAGALAVSGATRDQAEALLARLPEAARAKYPTPESLAALAVVGEMLKAETLQILGHTMSDPWQAIVSVRSGKGAKEGKLPMRLGPDGWQLLVPDTAIAAIERKMSLVTTQRPAPNEKTFEPRRH